MFSRRLLSGILLVTFMPVAAGCSSLVDRPIAQDPLHEADVLISGEAKGIEGYTLATGEFREWDGTIQPAPPDSLQFARKRLVSDRNYESVPSQFRLARSDVASVRISDAHPGRTAGLIFGGTIALGFLVGAMMAASGPW